MSPIKSGPMACEYCHPNEAGNLKWLRDEPDNWAWLQESSDEWGIVVGGSTRCCGADCTSELYVKVRHCPMCGREL
jgi:hypothetical protein